MVRINIFCLFARRLLIDTEIMHAQKWSKIRFDLDSSEWILYGGIGLFIGYYLFILLFSRIEYRNALLV